MLNQAPDALEVLLHLVLRLADLVVLVNVSDFLDPIIADFVSNESLLVILLLAEVFE